MMPVFGHCPSFALKNKVRSGFRFLACYKKHNLFLLIICSSLSVISQDSSLTVETFYPQGKTTSQQPFDATVHKKRIWLVTGVNVVGYGASLVILNNTWYKNYPHTSFHTFNDSKEWLQVDKLGHGWTAYNTGRISAGMWRWAGLSQNKAAIIGGVSGALYLTVIEFLDGHSAKWGWSWSDMAANVIGSGMFISQELLWKEQRIQYKFSFHHKEYGEPMLDERANDLFGESWTERMLKDYNAQTYWLSANLKSFFSKSRLPAWLNLSVGYGADGMFGGFQNKWIDVDSAVVVDRTDVPRVRQFYLAPDIDFTKIRTNKKWLRTVFFCLNAFKCPAPTLMIDSKGKVKAYPLYF
ncbi:MAG: DUF2279 domain-containing protein [Bacteroidetes bacterium]|nr:MAG: DUF2279 domain-containing protein [Bacteroidota bacterium]